MAIGGFLAPEGLRPSVHESCFRHTSQWASAELCQRLQLQASSIGMNRRSESVILVVALSVSTS
jgi:hypothetical protein